MADRRTRLSAEQLEERSLPSVIVVTSTADTVARDGRVTLREAILAADTRRAVGDAPAPGPGAAVIRFAIPGGGLHVIQPRSPLPALTGGVTLDATSQPGYAGTPLVALDGSFAGPRADGLVLAVGGNTVRGLLIDRFTGNGVVVASGGNRLAGDWIGVDSTGYRRAGNGGDGVLVTGAGNTLGGTREADRLVVGGNRLAGFDLAGSHAEWNIIAGDYVGTDRTGFASVANGTGILIRDGARWNRVGGTDRAARNVVSGNAGDQLWVTGPGTTGNVVQGNFLGVDSSGESGALSGGDAVRIDGGATGNTVGGSAIGAGNLIGGAGHLLTNGRAVGAGVEIAGAGTTGNVVQGNWVGLDARGLAPLTDLAGGVVVRGATGNTIGGAGSAANVIADPVNAPGLAAGNHLLPGDWYFDSIRFLGHPEWRGGSFRL
jgi:CSLREA domain-containing protein